MKQYGVVFEASNIERGLHLYSLGLLPLALDCTLEEFEAIKDSEFGLNFVVNEKRIAISSPNKIKYFWLEGKPVTVQHMYQDKNVVLLDNGIELDIDIAINQVFAESKGQIL